MSKKSKLRATNAQTSVAKIEKPSESAIHAAVKVQSDSLSPSHEKPDPFFVFGICAAIATLIAFVFGQTYRFDFVNYDDNINVYDNYQVLRGLSWDSVVWAFSLRGRDYWHPLSMLSHAVDYQLFGAKAGGHHLHNVFWHIITSLLLFWTLFDLTGRLGRSAIAAVIFSIHPLRAESVAWISERKDVLSGVFFFLTILAYSRYARSPSLFRYILVALLFFLGLASKPTIMPLPFLLLVLDYWPLKRFNFLFENKGRTFALLFLEKRPLILLSIASLLEAAHGAKDVFEINKILPIQYRVGNALVSYATYLWQSIYPANLAALYPHPELTLRWTDVLVASALLMIISWVAWHQRTKRSFLLVGWLWYLGMLVPMIGLIQAGIAAHADRYTYLPQIGLIIGVVWKFGEFWENVPSARMIINISTCAVIATLAILCHAQTGYWRDSEALWTHATASTVRNCAAYNNLGHTYYKNGNYDSALANYSIAEKINPTYSPIYNNKALTYAKINRHEMAVVEFTKAIMDKPYIAALYSNRGHSFNFLEQYDAAIQDYSKAIELMKTNPDTISPQHKIEVYNNRIFCYVMLKKFDKAWEDVAAAEKLNLPVEDKLMAELKGASGRSK